MPTSYFSKEQRKMLISYYMGSYTDWYNDEPTSYDKPEIREKELNALGNAELYQFIKSETPCYLDPSYLESL